MNTGKYVGVTRVFTRYTMASLLATAISQVVLLALYWAWEADAMTASTVAFLVGAVPHFLLIRQWAWGNRGRAGRRAEIVAYVVVTAAGGALSIGITTAVDWLLAPLIDDRGWHAFGLVIAYLASGAPVFLLKFFALDRVFRRNVSNTPSAPTDSQDSETAISALQPNAA
ncbi:GtrA/DPMS transmembrane domain-containing protein [Kibdelosporangium persicum]|uniref:GtrA domain-containing protein n=1 Tax=Kibdelosporangium persicum TaxID=2698649 RepID=A0ABX2F8Q1_9PSEU|nr:GtrA domain-containing protein [Kibdelosporangium persicum]